MMKIVALVCMLAVVVASEEVDIRPTPVFLVGASNGIKKVNFSILRLSFVKLLQLLP